MTTLNAAAPIHHASKGFLAGMSVDALRRRAQTEPYKKLWTRLITSWRETLRRADRDGGSIGYGAVGWYSFSSGVVDAGLIWRLTGDRDAIAYVERCIGFLAAAYGPDSPTRALVKKVVHDGIPVQSHAEVPLAADLCRDGLSTEARDTLCRVLREHVIDQHDNGACLFIGGGCNIPVARNIAAATAALTWGEDCGHPDWQRVVTLGRDSTLAYFRGGLDEQGFPYEGPAYASGTADHLYRFMQLLKQRGIEDLFAIEPNTERFADALLALVFPNRDSFGNINDVGTRSPWSLPCLLLTARYFNRPDHLGLWYEFQGPDNAVRPYGDANEAYEKIYGAEWTQGWASFSNLLTFLYWDAEEKWTPVAQTRLPTAEYSPGTEMAVFRTSWSRDAVFANFLGTGRSHVSAGHIHNDCGHFSIFAHGDYLAIDTGRYNVDEDQHNTILVDGECFLPTGSSWGAAKRGGRLVNFHRHELLDYAMADMAAVKNCIWADRHFLFVRTGGDGGYVVTIDNLNKHHNKFSIWWQMHVNPNAKLEVTGPRGARVTGPNARLDVTFVIPDPRDCPADPHKMELRMDEPWWSLGANSDSVAVNARAGLGSSSVRRPRLVAEVTGLNGQVLAVLSPRHKSEAPLVVRDRGSERIRRVEIEHGDFTDTLIAALDHKFIKLSDVEALTELVLIRKKRSGEVVGVWSVDGRPVKVK